MVKTSDLVIKKSIKSKILKTIKKYDGTPMLLVGPSGCGKTTVIKGVAKLCKYEVLDIDFTEEYKHYRKSFFTKEQVILLDNLEEINGKKLKELVRFFVKDGRPLIMSCTEVSKDLNDVKKEFNIRATNYKFEIDEWIDWLSKKYNLERKIVEELVSTTGENKAVALNQLNMELTDNVKLTKKLGRNYIFANSFNKKIDRSEFYYQESLLPVFMWENYPKLYNNKIEYCANSASACAIVDTFEKQIQANQRFEFMPYVAKFTEEMIPYDYDQKIGFAPFPSYFGKMKKRTDDMLLEAQLKKKLEKIEKQKKKKSKK